MMYVLIHHYEKIPFLSLEPLSKVRFHREDNEPTYFRERLNIDVYTETSLLLDRVLYIILVLHPLPMIFFVYYGGSFR